MRGFAAGFTATMLVLVAAIAACKKDEKKDEANAGEEVARLIDSAAVCAARNYHAGSAVCRVHGNLLTCSREGCRAIQYEPGAPEISTPDAAPPPDAPLQDAP